MSKLIGHDLPSDLEHRDPNIPINDIDTGLYLQELSRLPNHILTLLRDSDLHCEVDLLDDFYRVIKVIKKREPEYNRGSDKFFAVAEDGSKVPVTEEQLDQMLNLPHSEEDILNYPDRLVSIESEYQAPRDTWDVIFDATSFVREAKRRIQALEDAQERLSLIDPELDRIEDIQEAEENLKKAKAAVREIPTTLSDEEIYSANWYPYPQDKRLSCNAAREIAEKIKTSDLTKRQVMSLISRYQHRRLTDNITAKEKLVQDYQKKAQELKPGREKAHLLIRARDMKQTASQLKMKLLRLPAPLSPEDGRKLWDLWKSRQIELHGEVQLQPWQLKKQLIAKLVREESRLSGEDIRSRVERAIEQIYHRKSRVTDRDLEIFNQIPLEEVEFAPCFDPSLLPTPNISCYEEAEEQEQYLNDTWRQSLGLGEPLEEGEEWLDNNLLSGGIE